MKARITRQVAAALIATFMTALAAFHTASAADLTVTVNVVETSGEPVPNAIITAISGDSTTFLAKTNASGTAVFVVPQGTVIGAAFQGRLSQRVTVQASFIRLVLAAPRIIGKVTSIASGFSHVAGSSPAAVAAGNVANALGLVANYRSRAQGGSGQQLLNGIPLELPSAPSQNEATIGGVPEDLVDSFEPTQADDGSVRPNFHLISPTPQTHASLSLEARSWLGSMLKATMSGHTGKLGYGFAIVNAGDQGVLASRTFLDVSGFAYDHSSNARHNDASAVLNYKLGTTDMSLAGVGSRGHQSDISQELPGDLPQGWGPGNYTLDDHGIAYVLASQQHGRDQLHALVVLFNGGLVDNANRAYFMGTPAPFSYGYSYSGSYDELAFTRVLPKESIGLKYRVTRVATSSFGQGPNYAALTGEQGLTISYEHGLGSGRAGFSLGGEQRQGSFPGKMLDAGAFLNFAVAGVDVSLSGHANGVQTQEASYVNVLQLSNPSTAQFTCDGSALVTGPSNTNGIAPRASTIVAAISKNQSNGQLVAGAFVSSTHNALQTVAVQGTAGLPPGYFSALQTGYASLCASSALTQAGVYVENVVSVPRLLGKEWYVERKWNLGQWGADLSYETYSLTPQVLPPSVPVASSTLIQGTQISGVPLHRANAIVWYKGSSGFTVSFAATFVSSNNELNLPPYTMASAGVSVPMRDGALNASAQNVFDVFSGPFVSPAYGVPIPTLSSSLQTLGTPLPRTWRVQYVFRVGSHS